ncbi:MAG: hypothetical protein GF346_11145 [Candidatus Eisenbacteria bacterium]|nr:hypothetical protein [Candidatus Latescibacterota bacterium]MBD3302991.1 hypothetical protein [Candidatus Eisenbacteria bacterium]
MDDPNEGNDPGRDSTPLEDLEKIVAEIRFSSHHADYKESGSWSLFAHPWPGERTAFDALLTIKPRAASTEEIAGHRIVLYGDEGAYLPSEPTNRHGQIWFKGLPGGEYRAQLVREEAAGLPRAVVPADRRIRAHLRKDESGNAVLDLQTGTRALAGRRIRFALGSIRGETTLALRPSGDRCEGSAPLALPFREAQARLLDLTVEIPPDEDDGRSGDPELFRNL